MGLLFAMGGILMLIVTRQWFDGLVLALMGWVLYSAATQTRCRVVQHEALRSISASDIMAKEFPLVSQLLSLGQLVREYILVTGQCYFVVADGAKLQGIVTMRNIKMVPKERWDVTGIAEIMTPSSELRTAKPQQSGSSLLEEMDELEISHLPVLQEDKVIGIVTRDSLVNLAKTRVKFGT
jgi:predicted transcriptional regulator